jgi:hypothetical protein
MKKYFFFLFELFFRQLSLHKKKNMRSSLFAIAVFVAAAAAATQSSTPFYITSPVAGTKYKAGDR